MAEDYETCADGKIAGHVVKISVNGSIFAKVMNVCALSITMKLLLAALVSDEVFEWRNF